MTGVAIAICGTVVAGVAIAMGGAAYNTFALGSIG